MARSGMKKSAHRDLHQLAVSHDSDDDSSDGIFANAYFPDSTDDSSPRDLTEPNRYSSPLSKYQESLTIQDFPQSHPSRLPPLTDLDYDLASLNTPILPQNERPLQPIDCIFFDVHFPHPLSPAQF
jgi:hypothetical protein